jgi:hypothetical protein
MLVHDLCFTFFFIPINILINSIHQFGILLNKKGDIVPSLINDFNFYHDHPIRKVSSFD